MKQTTTDMEITTTKEVNEVVEGLEFKCEKVGTNNYVSVTIHENGFLPYSVDMSPTQIEGFIKVLQEAVK